MIPDRARLVPRGRQFHNRISTGLKLQLACPSQQHPQPFSPLSSNLSSNHQYLTSDRIQNASPATPNILRVRRSILSNFHGSPNQLTPPTNRRQRVPLLIATFLGGTAAFVSFKFRAVMTRSEEVKKATSGTKANYSVVPGRSGVFLLSPLLLQPQNQIEIGFMLM